MSTFEWIEKLAKDELKMEESGEFDLYGSMDQTRVLESHTHDFLHQLKSLAQDMANRFNGYRGDRHSIKVFQISGTPSDFIIFRNHLKLVFANTSPGKIKVSFLTVRGGLYEEDLKEGQPKDSDIIFATLGPFNDAVWHYKDHIVTPTSLVRYYITEFIKNSLS
ncbi:hypothetical protein ACFLRA_02375 [Bdellovibrionota bacterium]